MDPQMKPFIQIVDFLHDDIYKAVDPLTDDEINWRHPHLTNSVGILLRHIAAGSVVAGFSVYWRPRRIRV